MGAQLPGSGSNGRRNRRGGAGFNDINVTPFVDVMLVLLIVFMVAAPMMTSGVTVDLPKTKAASLPGNDEPLNVSIKGDGSIYIQNSQAELEELGSKLQAILGEKTETRIFVRGDTKIDYGQVMQVIGEITGAGFTKVALVTDQNNPRRRS
jgi:biopolymer transport protein TolR